MNVGKALRRWRTRKGLTQREVAEHLGVSTSAYSQMELDKISMKLQHAVKFAEAVKASLDMVFGKIDEEGKGEVDLFD